MDDKNISGKLKALAELYPDKVQKFAETIMIYSEAVEKLEHVNNKMLSDLLIKEVWSDVSLFSVKDAVLTVAIERLAVLEDKKPEE